MKNLGEHPMVQFFSFSSIKSLDDLESVFQQKHKYKRNNAVYAVTGCFNPQFCNPVFYKLFKFIYLIRDPKYSLPIIFNNHKQEEGYNYYCFRLRRICEMARQTPNALLLTHPDLCKDDTYSLIKEYLQLSSFDFEKIQDEYKENLLDDDLLSKAQGRYEHHLFYLKQLNLLKI